MGNRRGAFTLTELLVSISIVVFLLLAGVAVYWRMSRGFAMRAAVSHIEAELRGARAFAVHERCPSAVILEPAPDPEKEFSPVQRVYSLSRRTVGHWHFEQAQLKGDTLYGALGQEGRTKNTMKTMPGRIGRALLFSAGDDQVSVASAYLDGLRDGVFVGAYVRPDASGLTSGLPLPIVCKGTSAGATFSLTLIPGKALFTLRGGVDAESGSPTAETDPLIRPGEWAHVGLAYDGESLVLSVNGREVKTASGTGPLKPRPDPLLIGSNGVQAFRGRLDELRLSALVTSEVRRLPRSAEVFVDPGGSSDGRIHFDEEGRLDTRFHGRLVRFRVIGPDRVRRHIQLNWLGGVEVAEQEREAK